MLTIVAAVLHIGNITFTQGDSDEAVISDEAAQQALLNVATFLEVRQQPACALWLCSCHCAAAAIPVICAAVPS